MKTINLPVFGIAVTLTGDGGASIQSDLHESLKDICNQSDYKETELFNASMDGIESMILAHASAGVDIESPAYLEGIETAVGSCSNNI